MGIIFYSQIIFQYSNIFTGHLQKKRARGHLFLFPYIFLVFKYFYRASSEKKSPWASSEEKSPWATFSIPKYFSVFKYFYRASSEKKSPWASSEKKSPAKIFGTFQLGSFFLKMPCAQQKYLNTEKYFTGQRASSEKKSPVRYFD